MMRLQTLLFMIFIASRADAAPNELGASEVSRWLGFFD